MRKENREKHAKGGKAGMQEYNAQGSHEEHEAMDEKPGFKKGGKAKAETEHKRKEHEKLKSGGMCEGKEPEMRAHKRPRRAAGGRTPYSTGSMASAPSTSKAGDGHEGVRPSEPD